MWKKIWLLKSILDYWEQKLPGWDDKSVFEVTVTKLSKLTNDEFSPRNEWGDFFTGFASFKPSDNPPRSKGSGEAAPEKNIR